METKTRILIADANADFTRMLSELIAQEKDMEVAAVAADGLEALSLLAESKPDLLLMDLVLPRLDGLELLRRLPETGAGCAVIVLSAFFNGKVVADCSALGADYFVPKPCEPTALLSRIRQLCNEGTVEPGEGYDCRAETAAARTASLGEILALEAAGRFVPWDYLETLPGDR